MRLSPDFPHPACGPEPLGANAEAEAVASRWANTTQIPNDREHLPNGSLSMPQGFRRESRPFGERGELRPTNLGMHTASHAAIGPANDILVPDNSR
jgi:hypothetical protein